MVSMGSTQGQAPVPSSRERGELSAHEVGSYATAHNLKNGDKNPALDDWMSLAFSGSYTLSEASIYNDYADSQELNVAAQLVQKLGSSTQTFKVSIKGSDDGTYMTIGDMISKASYYAGQAGQSGNAGSENSSKAGNWQSQAGQAQAEQSQNVQIGQQFTSQETNQATSVDTQTTNTTTSEMQSLNSTMSQWVQLSGPLSA